MVNPYNKTPEGVKPSCYICRWEEICIDPCDDCINMKNLKFEGDKLVEGTLCKFEQGDHRCRKIAGNTCKSFEPKLGGVDLELISAKESMGWSPDTQDEIRESVQERIPYDELLSAFHYVISTFMEMDMKTDDGDEICPMMEWCDDSCDDCNNNCIVDRIMNVHFED